MELSVCRYQPCDVLLNAIETGDLPAGDELNNAKGEALALRALCHFNL